MSLNLICLRFETCESTFKSWVSRHQHFWILITQRDFKKTFFLEKKYNKPFANQPFAQTLLYICIIYVRFLKLLGDEKGPTKGFLSWILENWLRIFVWSLFKVLLFLVHNVLRYLISKQARLNLQVFLLYNKELADTLRFKHIITNPHDHNFFETNQL